MKEGIITATYHVNQECLHHAAELGHVLEMVDRGLLHQLASEIMETRPEITEVRDRVHRQTEFSIELVVMSPMRYRELKQAEKSVRETEWKLVDTAHELRILKAELKELSK